MIKYMHELASFSNLKSLGLFSQEFQQNITDLINLRKGKDLKKHRLHSENSSLSFIEAVHQW